MSFLRKSFHISNRRIGLSYQPFIIAEAGVNHNGDINLAKRLVLEAKLAGADAVKFQTFKAEKVVTPYAKSVRYQVRSTGELTQLHLLKQLELSEPQHRELKSYCDEQEIIFLSTPTSISDIDLLCDLDIAAFKIASPDLPSLPMLEYISKKGKPIILSTGMATLDEIEESIGYLKNARNNGIAIMQCTSSYPSDLQYVNLNVISSLQKLKVPVGFSDHSLGVGCAIAAVNLGACIIEKHFTISKKMKGPDHAMSLEQKELELLIKGAHAGFEGRYKGKENLIKILDFYDPNVAKNLDIVLGSFKKKPTPSEDELILKTRKSIVASKFIPKGTIIPADAMSAWEDILSFKRPGNGLSPKYLYQILGKVTNRDLNRDEQIALSDFS